MATPSEADGSFVDRSFSPNPSTPRLYGGMVLGWTWPLASLLARLRMGWYLWLAGVGIVVGLLVGAASLFIPELLLSNKVEVVFTVGGLGPFLYLMVVFVTAPVAARWRWAEQQLLLRWAASNAGTVQKRTEYWDFVSTEWEGSGSVPTDAPILAGGNAIGYPTLVSKGRTEVGRAVLRFGSAVARSGRSRGSRDVILFAFVPVGLPPSLNVDRICCCRRAATTVAQARLLNRLRHQTLESLEWDRRVWVGIGHDDDELDARRILDPVTIDHFASSDTVWEITRAGVTAYRQARTFWNSDVDALVADAELLARRLEQLPRAHGIAAA